MPASRQARPAGQSPCEVHPQWYPDPVPLGTQTVPDWFAASQTSQSSPLPQALSTLPGWQVPSLQQPPWQMEWFASPHALSHWPVVVLQAMPIGQSPAPLHVHSPQLPPQPSSPHALPVQFGVQHIPNFTAAAFAHTRLQQLWLVRQVRPSGLQPPASASRCPPSVSTTAARRNARATCFITHLPARKQARVRLLQDATIPRSPTGVKRSPGRDPASSGLGRSMASSAQRASAPAVARGALRPLPCAPENRCFVSGRNVGPTTLGAQYAGVLRTCSFSSASALTTVVVGAASRRGSSP